MTPPEGGAGRGRWLLEGPCAIFSKGCTLASQHLPEGPVSETFKSTSSTGGAKYRPLVELDRTFFFHNQTELLWHFQSYNDKVNQNREIIENTSSS